MPNADSKQWRLDAAETTELLAKIGECCEDESVVHVSQVNVTVQADLSSVVRASYPATREVDA